MARESRSSMMPRASLKRPSDNKGVSHEQLRLNSTSRRTRTAVSEGCSQSLQ